jgi:hypothetical protein
MPNILNEKKIRELKKLRTFYPDTEYKLVRQSEKPDFVLKDSEGKVFGVEVTEYYDSNTSGRFKNIPNYLNQIINKEFIHKQDVGVLEVGEITIVDDAGKELSHPGKGVLRNLPQSPDRIEVLKKLVTSKNAKYAQYNSSLETIDLLIHDTGDLTAGLEIQKDQILKYLRKQEAVNTLVSSFRNVVLVIEEPNKPPVIITLKSS